MWHDLIKLKDFVCEFFDSSIFSLWLVSNCYRTRFPELNHCLLSDLQKMMTRAPRQCYSFVKALCALHFLICHTKWKNLHEMPEDDALIAMVKLDNNNQEKPVR